LTGYGGKRTKKTSHLAPNQNLTLETKKFFVEKIVQGETKKGISLQNQRRGSAAREKREMMAKREESRSHKRNWDKDEKEPLNTMS